ncbi:MAG TPA: diguanylate cyclase [Polyangiaceae bacterium]|nr:diguanylate cyclase [Polyangiaceae bacterium]
MDLKQARIILMDVSDASREVMARRLSAQGYLVETASDAASGADMALSSPPDAVIADLWMPSISGVQLCRLLKAEAATSDVPVVLRGESDDPRSRFWAERAGAVAYVRKGRMGELVRVLGKAIDLSNRSDGFFVQLSSGSVDIRDRIARYLDAALFDSVIAAEVRSLAACGSFERLFDLLVQFLSQVMSYRWLAVSTVGPEHFALHHHPSVTGESEAEARAALELPADTRILRVVDEDPAHEPPDCPALVASIPFGNAVLGKLALSPAGCSKDDARHLLGLVARELGGPLRMAALMDEQQRLAAVDPLTGLKNRRSFLELANIEVARSSRYGLPMSVLLLDVDHFKSINDSHGHAGGDQVLSAISASLRKQLRTPDLAARWGGEEFVIALPSTDCAGAQVVAERLRESVERLPISYEKTSISVTISLGLAELRPGESLESVIDRADRAMYGAKVGGRNRVVVAADPPALREKSESHDSEYN